MNMRDMEAEDTKDALANMTARYEDMKKQKEDRHTEAIRVRGERDDALKEVGRLRVEISIMTRTPIRCQHLDKRVMIEDTTYVECLTCGERIKI